MLDFYSDVHDYALWAKVSNENIKFRTYGNAMGKAHTSQVAEIGDK